MRHIDKLHNALQAVAAAKAKGDYELALIEAHNAVDSANEYALEIGCEFIASRKRARVRRTELSPL